MIQTKRIEQSWFFSHEITENCFSLDSEVKYKYYHLLVVHQQII